MITNLSFYDTADDLTSFSRHIARLGVAQQEAERLKKIIETFDFRIDVPVVLYASSSGVSVRFSVPEDLSEDNQHLLIADVVRAFGVKLHRKFNTSDGTFRFMATIAQLALDISSDVYIENAKASNCKVTAITEMKPVTRYVSDCSGGEAEKSQSDSVGVQ